MRLHNPFARHTGRHVPRSAPRTPFICLNCDEGYHHGRGITWPCECVCVAPLAIEAPRRERPSWWERVSGGVSALIGATAQGLARLIGYGALEEGPDEPGGTCDWGDCGEIASDTRWDDEHGWLPVCAVHAAPEDVPRPSRETGPAVGGPGHTHAWPETAEREGRALHGLNHAHNDPPETQVMGAVKVGDTYLAQAGTPIGPWCTCIIGSDQGRARTGVQDCPVHGTLPPEDDEDRTEQWGAIRFSGHHQARNMWGPPAPETRWDYLARTGVPESLAYVAEILAAPLPRVKALTA